jgi:colanic acid/amylovoran biosynthesis glycosyltransferase
MSSLLVISSAPATIVDGKPFLDKKFVKGMRLYSELWDGPIHCLLKKKSDTFPFGETYDRDRLPFDVTLLPEDRAVGAEDIAAHDLILCGGDSHEHLHLADLCRESGKRLIFIIEYSPETRRQIILLDRSRSLPRKAYSLLWTMRQENRRRRAFRLADGIQSNGYPAFASYRPLNPNVLMYFDNRVGERLLATRERMDARHRRLTNGAQLRLMHSGRLEPMKGSQDLIPIARTLVAKGVDFRLDIFGGGSLEAEIRNGISEYGLEDRVKLHGVVDFETELVPFAQAHADIYMSCHRQSDPSCTYIESMGCGLPVVGYANRMWSSLCRDSGAGWAVPLGNVEALAEAIAASADDRHRLVACSRAARAFAGRHSFEQEFHRRVNHLRALV